MEPKRQNKEQLLDYIDPLQLHKITVLDVELKKRSTISRRKLTRDEQQRYELFQQAHKILQPKKTFLQKIKEMFS